MCPWTTPPLSRCASGSRSTDKPVSTTYSKTAALLDYDGNIFARDVFTSVSALLFRDAVAPYFHPRLAWATSKVNTPSGWPGRTSTSCDLTVGGTAGLPSDKIIVHNHLIGGGFGRRLEADGVTRAVEIAQHVDGPVKVVWTREEDIQHDMYRPYWFDRLSAGLDAKGMPVAWNNRFAGSSVLARWAPPFFKDGLDPDTTEGAIDLVYALRTCTSSMCGWNLPAFRPRSGAASGRPTTCS